MSEERSHKERLLKNFNFSEPAGISGGAYLPLSNAAETALAAITLSHINSNDRVLIQADVGWQISGTASTANPEVRFRIHRDGALGPVVFDTIDSGSGLGYRFTTGLTHAEANLPHGMHQYVLTAFIVTGAVNDVLVIGPINLDGSVIDENET